MTMEFGKVPFGSKFTTPNSKRYVTCVKVGDTLVDGRTCNAVILSERPSEDTTHAGEMIYITDTQEVDVKTK